jgi:hypothetical protein
MSLLELCGAGASIAVAIFDQCISSFYAPFFLPGDDLGTIVEQRAAGFIPGIGQRILLNERLCAALCNISAHLIPAMQVFR